MAYFLVIDTETRDVLNRVCHAPDESAGGDKSDEARDAKRLRHAKGLMHGWLDTYFRTRSLSIVETKDYG